MYSLLEFGIICKYSQYRMFDDINHGIDVNNKEQWAQHITLRDTNLEFGCAGSHSLRYNMLGSACQETFCLVS